MYILHKLGVINDLISGSKPMIMDKIGYGIYYKHYLKERSSVNPKVTERGYGKAKN